MGTRSYPLGRTEGEMGMGEGTISFSDEGERTAFIEHLGDAWRTKIFKVNWVLSARGKPNIKKACIGCRVLSEPVSDEQGAEALGGDITFSFLYMTINGKVPHEGLPSPTSVG
jgi:hypothetical protein